MQVEPHIRVFSIDGWALARVVTKIIDDGIFQVQGGEFRMFDRAVGDGGIDGECIRLRQKIFPQYFPDPSIEIFVGMTVKK